MSCNQCMFLFTSSLSLNFLFTIFLVHNMLLILYYYVSCCLFFITMCHACSKEISWPRIFKVSEISTIVNFIKLFLQEELDNLASNFPSRFNIYYVLNQVLFLLYGFESNGRFVNLRLISCIFVSVLFSQH